MFVRPSSRENKEYNSRSVFRVSPRSDFTLVSLTHRSLGQLFLPRSFWNAPMQTQRYIVCGAKKKPNKHTLG